MKKELFSTIKTTLLTSVEVKTVKLWRKGVIDNLDTLEAFPLVFIEFISASYNTIARNAQECNGAQFAAHVLYKTIDEEDEEIFDISQAIFEVMQRVGMKRVSEGAEDAGGEIIDWKIIFELPRFEDTTAAEPVRPNIWIKKPPLLITEI